MKTLLLTLLMWQGSYHFSGYSGPYQKPYTWSPPIKICFGYTAQSCDYTYGEDECGWQWAGEDAGERLRISGGSLIFVGHNTHIYGTGHCWDWEKWSITNHPPTIKPPSLFEGQQGGSR